MRPVVFALSLVLSSLALAGGSPRFTQQYGYTFSEIGDPGNPAYVYDNRIPGKPDHRIGRVDRRYRIATTETSVDQWGEFVLAYSPFVGDDYNSPAFSGGYYFAGFNGEGVPQYGFDAEILDHPTALGWRYAARYCNWLHNGKPTGDDVEQWVFETGAYDTSTFTQNPDGSLNDQRERSPGARFFIPTLDEWVKAVYWDPERNEDEADWQLYPYGDTVPVPGDPDEGGQTNAGRGNDGGPFDVGSYPVWTTPWGLLDASGGQSEWLENASGNGVVRLAKGTNTTTLLDDLAEEEFIESSRGALIGSPVFGLRIAAAVPGPGGAVGTIIFCIASLLRRTRA